MPKNHDRFGWSRRREAALRLPPLRCKLGLAGHDPHARGWESRPSTFSLTPAQLAAHAETLRRNGWTLKEIELVLDLSEVTT